MAALLPSSACVCTRRSECLEDIGGAAGSTSGASRGAPIASSRRATAHRGGLAAADWKEEQSQTQAAEEGLERWHTSLAQFVPCHLWLAGKPISYSRDYVRWDSSDVSWIGNRALYE